MELIEDDKERVFVMLSREEYDRAKITSFILGKSLPFLSKYSNNKNEKLYKWVE